MVEGGRRSKSVPRRLLNTDFREYLGKWIPLSIAVGVVGGLFSVMFQALIVLISDLAASTSLPWYLIILVPATGGLVAGLILTAFPQARGFGNDEVIEAIHHRGGRLDWRLVPSILLASSFTIGSGGSAGRESPASLIGAGISSVIGERFGLSRSDMRILIIAGTAACFSALFKAPLGCAVFALEIPYKNDIESRAAIPALLSSIVGYLMAVSVFGLGPYMDVSDIAFNLDHTALAMVAIVGALVGLGGIAFITLFKVTRGVFSKIRLPFAAKVALGGLLTGVVGLAAPEVLGLGEETMAGMINGGVMALSALALLLVAKMLATSLTVGSGGAGGVFFPSLFIGGTIGALTATTLGLQDTGLYVVVGMGAMMAGVTKTPIAAPIMITEIVGGYGVLIPVMIASVLAYILTGDYSIYQRQLTRRQFRFDISTLGQIRVADMMRTPVIAMRKGMTVTEALVTAGREAHYIYPVVDGENRIIGQVKGEVLRRIAESAPDALVEDIMSRFFQSIPSDMEGVNAFERMNSSCYPQAIRFMVVDPADGETLVGILSRIDVLEALESLDEWHHS